MLNAALEPALMRAPQILDTHPSQHLAARFAAGFIEIFQRLAAESAHEIRTDDLYVGVARSVWQLDQAHALVERQYRSAGFLAHDASLERSIGENEIVIVAMDSTRALGTVTLRMDRGEGLLADARYQTEIDARRSAGACVAEFSRLAMDTDLNILDILDPMIEIACRVGYHPTASTEVFVECHPRHAAFYRRVMGFQIKGQETLCERVGAPAVLLHTPLSALRSVPTIERRRQQRSAATQIISPACQESGLFAAVPAMA
ncbi:MAG: hypothetical protein FWD62_14195 [Betaproteobacteria bacterium]|nr:hypothetical protein [Betaproteobacteria bacterium]